MRHVAAHVRVYARPRLPAPDPTRYTPKPGWRPWRFGERVLVFDTETTLDPAQQLLVGAYQLHEWRDREGRYVLLEEGLVGGGLDPAGRARLRRYARARGLPLLSREEFCRLLIQEGYDLGTLIVGFNLPFDLGAVALRWGRGRRRWRRGFRLVLLDTAFEPRLRLRHARGPTFVEWSTYGIEGRRNPREPEGRRPFAGRFCDLREAAHALVGEKHTLESACRRFGADLPKLPPGELGRVSRELIDYCRRDVELAWRLFLAVREEWNRHPFTPIPSPVLPPGARAGDTPDLAKSARLLTRMRTPASLAKGYLDLMGFRPRLLAQPEFPPERLGQAMEAFYGGRIEARYQGAILPVVSLDILSTYLSVNVLMQLHQLDTAERLEVADCTEEARGMLTSLTQDDLFRPDVWPRLAAFCEIEPQGDFLPVRYPDEPGDAPTVHMKRVWAAPGATLWYALPDLIYSTLCTGRPPRVPRAWRIVPKGMMRGLRPVRFRGEVLLDPHQDFYRALRDARVTDAQPRLRAARAAGRTRDARELDRLQAAMKAVGEPLGYGVYVEVDEKDLGAAEADVWTGRGSFAARASREECPGWFFFAPRGAVVTAGARLLLGMMERCVARFGAAIVTMHTDSVTVVATETGGDVPLPRRPGRPDAPQAARALSDGEVERVRERFVPLSGIPGVSLWKREPENEPHPEAARDPRLYILSQGPGRYALFNVADEGRIALRDRKETALGHLVPPPGHTREQVANAVWEAMVREARGERDAVQRLPFAREPVLGRLPITTPELLKTLRTRPRGSRTATAPGARPFGLLAVAYPMSEQGLLGRQVYWSGRCRLRRIETVGCPAPHDECPYRASCPLAYPIRPVTYDVPGPDVLRRGRWFDWRTGRPLPRLHALPVDTPLSAGLRVRTWAEYVQHTLPQENRWWLDESPDVRVTGTVHTGKEARHLEDIAASLRVPGEEVLIYRPESLDDDEILRAAIRGIPMRFLIEQTRLSRRGIQLFKNNHTKSLHAANRSLLWQAVAAWVAEHPEAGMIAVAPAITRGANVDGAGS
jgi:hypothetical protein